MINKMHKHCGIITFNLTSYELQIHSSSITVLKCVIMYDTTRILKAMTKSLQWISEAFKSQKSIFYYYHNNDLELIFVGK